MTTPASEPTREAFEAWGRKQYWRMDRDADGSYRGAFAQEGWITWQAAHSHARAEMEARDAEIARLRKAVQQMFNIADPVAPRTFVRCKDALSRIVRHARTTLAEPQPTGEGEG